MTPRTDPHSPANLVTEDYEFAFCGVHHLPEGEWPADVKERMARINQLVAEGYRFNDVHGSEQCSHCGTRINYYAVLKHVPTKTLIHVGETCLDNRFSLATSEFRELHEAAVAMRAQHLRKQEREAFQADHGEIVTYLEAKVDALPYQQFHDDNFFVSLSQQLQRKGCLSDGQVAALAKCKAQDEERAAERAKDDEEHPAAPVIEGRIEITGKVLAVKAVDHQYGSTLKMLVRDDRGFKVWGTLPDSIALIDETDEAGNVIAQHGPKGYTVSFTAAVTASEDDPTFGFFKRPTKARALEAQV